VTRACSDAARLDHHVGNIFPVRIMRFWSEVYFLYWGRSTHVELEDGNDEELKDIGLEPPKRDFDTVKPFWMP
jgi:uncharacterized protein YjiS (DUF1127 family)